MLIDDQLSRPEKLTNAQTILYEIMMLRYAKGCLQNGGTSWTMADEWAHLEVFLLHFRNLIEFFNDSPARQVRGDDLSIVKPTDIWTDGELAQIILDRLKRNDLYVKYEKDARPQSISKYLQHCTAQRTSEVRWNVDEMYRDLEPVLAEFESLIPIADRERAFQWQKTMSLKCQKKNHTYASTFSDSGNSETIAP
jgi:hypothetical protein